MLLPSLGVQTDGPAKLDGPTDLSVGIFLLELFRFF
jgi:hypothetical protein